MRADPELKQTPLMLDSEGSMILAYARGPIAPNSLELQRRMARVRFQQLEILTGKFLDMAGQLRARRPEFRDGEMPHSSFTRPAS
jgi:hypothetical protein